MGGRTCEEWFAELRHSLARGEAKRRVGNAGKKVIVGSDNNRDLPARLVTVEAFHRECGECVRVATYSCGLGPGREIINHAKMVREWLRSVNAPEEVAARVRQNIPNLPPLGTVIEDV